MQQSDEMNSKRRKKRSMRRENVGQTDEVERERVTAKNGRRKGRANQFQKQQFENHI
jgi:hypothetical protein